MKQNFKHENKTSKLGTKGISEMKKIRNRTFLIKNKASTLKTKIQTNFKIGRIFFFLIWNKSSKFGTKLPKETKRNQAWHKSKEKIYGGASSYQGGGAK